MAKRSNNNFGGRRPTGEKPYDVNNSFVKKMATKVTDLIPQRSWISKWFNSPGGNGEVLNDGENTEEQDIEEESLQPPSKRPRIRMDMTHPAGTFAIKPRKRVLGENHEFSTKHYPLKDDTLENFVQPSVITESNPTRSFVSSTPAMNIQVHDSTIPKTNITASAQQQNQQDNNGTTNGADDNSESGESTSGCSSLISQANKRELSSMYINSPFANRKNFVNDKLTFTNHLQSPRSLLIDGRDSMNSRKPNFNASIISMDDNSFERSMASPFYSGNTTFGGANAVGHFRQSRGYANNVNEFQLKVPKRTSIRVKPSNVPSNVSDSSGMSQTAKRILEALEHFSSPLIDAKKIPIKSPISSLSIGKKRSREEYSGPISHVGLRHLTRELAVPTVPDMLKLKRRQRLQDTTLAARKIVSAHSDPPPTTNTATTCSTISPYYLREDNDSSKFFGKLRTKSKKKPDFEDTGVKVNLSGIPLPITNLPSFDIPLPASNADVTNAKIMSKTKSPKIYQENYKFSSPIKFSVSSQNLRSINNFTFSEPMNTDHQKTHIDNLSNISASVNSPNFTLTSHQPMTNFVWSGSSTAARPKENKTQSKTDEILGGTKVAVELKSGSVMDILEKKSSNNIGIDIWECNECFIKNNANDEQCAACKARKSDSTKNISSASNKSNSSIGGNDTQCGFQFKMNNDKWKCNSCLAKNAPNQIKCTSCMASRQEPKNGDESSIVTIEPNVDIMEKFRSPIGTWECSGCMLKNPPDVINCPCCSASKPGLVKATQKHVAESKKDVGENRTLTEFNSMKKQDLWECPTCMVKNKLTDSACVCCTTPCPKDKSSSVSSSSSSSLSSSSSQSSSPSSTSTSASSSSSSSSSTSSSSSSLSLSSVPNELIHNEKTPKIIDGFGDKFKNPEGTWSCDTCMVQNKRESNECIACGGSKCGNSNKSVVNFKGENASSTLQFNFGTSANVSQLQFGGAKSSENKSAIKANGFTFGMPTTQQSNQTFTFGVPSNSEKSPKFSVTAISMNNDGENTASKFKSNLTATNLDNGPDIEASSVAPMFGIPKTDSNKSSATSDTSQKTTPFIFGTSSQESTTNGTTNTLKDGQNPLIDNQQTTLNYKSSDVNKSVATFSFVVPASVGIAIKDNSILSTSTITSTNGGQTPFTFSAPKTSTPEGSSFVNIEKPSSLPDNKTITPTGFTFTDTKFTEGSQTNTHENKNAITFGESSQPVSSFSGGNIAVTTSDNNITETKNATLHFSTSNNEDKKSINFVIQNKDSTFGVVDPKPSTFGETNVCKSSIDNLSAFNNNDNPVFNVSTSTFGAASANSTGQSTALPIFGSSNSTANIFGSSNNSNYATQQQQTQSVPQNIFSSIKPSDNINQGTTSSPFTFSATSSQQNSQTPSKQFNFTSEHDSTNSATSKPMFNFGSNVVTTCQPAASVITFGTPNFGTSTATRFSFNTPKLDGPSAFGQASATALPNIFGSSQSTSSLGQSSPATSFTSSSAGTSVGFNFGTPTQASSSASASAISGFNFSAASTQPTQSAGFNFNASSPSTTSAIAFDPNTRPAFNFTGGSVPPTFNATPQPVGNRKIKKAVRRIPPRT